MAYWKSFSINGKAVKTLALNGRTVKLQGEDHSKHGLRFTMTGGTMGDVFVMFDSPWKVEMTVSAWNPGAEEPFASETLEREVAMDTKYFLSDIVGIDHLEKGQFYQVFFALLENDTLARFNGSTSLDGTYEVSGNLSEFGVESSFTGLFEGDATFTSAELYYEGQLNDSQFETAFKDCVALKSFRGNLVQGAGSYWQVPAGCFRSAFEGCTSLKSCDFFSTEGEPVVGTSSFERTFFNCTSLESVGMGFVSGAYIGDSYANTECWECDGEDGYKQCFYNCEMLHGLRPVFLAMKNNLDGNYAQMFYRANLGSSENLFTGAIYVGSASYYDQIGYTGYSGFTDVFKNAKVGEIVYPVAFEDDSGFDGASGSPEFGARVTEISYRDVN